MTKKRPRGGEAHAQQPEAGRPKEAVPEGRKEAKTERDSLVVVNPDGLCWDGAKWVKGWAAG